MSGISNQSIAVLKKNSGASRVGTSDGETVEDRLSSADLAVAAVASDLADTDLAVAAVASDLAETDLAVAAVASDLASTDLAVAGKFAAENVIDEDDFSSDSATKVPTQQSVKAYVDSSPVGVTLVADIAPSAGISLDLLSIFTSEYDTYLVVFSGLLPDVSSRMKMRFANGGVVDTGANYRYTTAATGGGGGSTSMICAEKVESDDVGVAGRLWVYNANDNSSIKAADSRMYAGKLSSQLGVWNMSVGYVGGAISGIQLYWEDGSDFVAVGRIKVYGYTEQ